MYPTPIFQDRSEAENLDFAAARAFGVLAISAPSGPVMVHVPFVLEDRVADMHLLRSNAVLRALEAPMPAVLAVSGPDGYVSPDWYGVDNQVPTWNYVAVHLRGRLERRPQTEIRVLLERQSAAYEARLAPKPSWTLDKMAGSVLEQTLRMIVPCRLRVETVEGTWKLSQNKPDAVREAAAKAIGTGFGQELGPLAALMRGTR